VLVVWEGVQVAEEEVVVKEKAEAEMGTAGVAVEAVGSESEGRASFSQCTVHCKHPRCDTQCHTPA